MNFSTHTYRLLLRLALISGLGVLLTACGNDADFSGASPAGDAGRAGSLARFLTFGDRLYTVDDQFLNIIDIANPDDPKPVKRVYVGERIETIFARHDGMLFLGSQQGMYIYDRQTLEAADSGVPVPWNVTDAERIELERTQATGENDVQVAAVVDPTAFVPHVFSCDPVVANDSFAYVTLRQDRRAWWGTNELQVIDIRDIRNPVTLRTYPMEGPYGLGLTADNKELYVCDAGIKVFNTDSLLVPESRVERDPATGLIAPERYYDDIPARDLIPLRDLLLVVAEDGFYQYRYENGGINLLSSIPIER